MGFGPSGGDDVGEAKGIQAWIWRSSVRYAREVSSR